MSDDPLPRAILRLQDFALKTACPWHKCQVTQLLRTVLLAKRPAQRGALRINDRAIGARMEGSFVAKTLMPPRKSVAG